MPEKRKASEEPEDGEQSDSRRHRPFEFYPPESFRGTLYVGERIEDAEEAIRRAREITINARTSTNEDFMLAMFTDASTKKEHGRTSGGYAVVFENYCPYTPYKGQRFEMAWNMRDIPDSSVGEAFALAQTLQVAAYQLRAIPRNQGTPVKTVVLFIFSDAFEVIRMIKGGYSYLDQNFRQDLMVKIVRLVQQLSHEVCNIPGYDVSIEGYWVKGHAGVEGNDRADKLSKRARRESRNIFIIKGKEQDANLLPPAVHIQLLDDIEMETTRHRPAQAQGARNGHGRDDGGRNYRPRYPHERGNNGPSFSPLPFNSGGTYSPPPWASESFNPSLDPRGMPRYPRKFPSSSVGGQRPPVSERSRPESDEPNRLDDIGPGFGPSPARQREPASITGTARANDAEKPAPKEEAPVVHKPVDNEPIFVIQELSTVNYQLADKERLEGQDEALTSQQDGEKMEPEVVLEAQASFHGRIGEQSQALEEHAVPSNITSEEEPVVERQAIEKHNALERPVADDQEPIAQKFDEEEKAASEPEVQEPVSMPAVGTEAAVNEQALACHQIVDQEEPLPKREGQIPFNHEAVLEKEPTPDLEVQTPVNPAAAEEDESAIELVLNEPTLVDLQLEGECLKWCERRSQDALALADDEDEDGPDETDLYEEVMSEEQTQAAVDRQLVEEAEAALARMMASEVQEHVSLGPLSVGVQVL